MNTSTTNQPTGAPRPRAASLFTPAVRLTLVGLLSQIIYVTYIIAFPLIPHTLEGGPAADLEILMRDDRWFAPIYVAGILGLYYLFWRALKIVVNFNPVAVTPQPARAAHHLKLLILAFGLVFAFTLLWLYPITANDLFRYVVRGRVWAIYGQSPLATPPSAFPDDPYTPFAGEFAHLASVYGPLWELVVQVPLRLGATSMVAGTVGVKLMVLLGYLGCAVLLGWVATPEKSSSLAALTFFAWNPLILMQGAGNGHNDLIFMALMVLGIVLWQRRWWWAAGFVLTLAVLAKAAALLIIPIFGLAMLRREPAWGRRVTKTIILLLTGGLTALLMYAAFGPFSETLAGVSQMLGNRRGFAIASATRMVLREILPRHLAEPIPRTTGRYIFIIFYAWLLWQVWRNRLNVVTATFLAYFSQLMLGRTFRIWYPMWLVPLAALHFTPATFWRTFLLGLTAELSIVNYFVVWRWWLRNAAWGVTGWLAAYWNYWTVMHLLTVPWLFGIPLLGPILLRRLAPRHYRALSPPTPPQPPGQ